MPNRYTIPLFLTGITLFNAAMATWLYNQKDVVVGTATSSTSQQEILSLIKEQGASIKTLQQATTTLQNKLTNPPMVESGNDKLTKEDVEAIVKGFKASDTNTEVIQGVQAQISQLQELMAQKISENKEQVKVEPTPEDISVASQQQEASNSLTETTAATLSPQQVFEQFTQSENKQKQIVEAHIQQMDSSLQGTPDYVAVSSLESTFQGALNRKLQENAGLTVSLSSVSCSNTLCKVSLSGNMDGDDPTAPGPFLQLLELRVIPDNTDFMTVPTENGMSIYIGQNGQPLPQPQL